MPNRTELRPFAKSDILEHALPFQAMFEELQVVRASHYLDGVGLALFPEDEWKKLIADDKPAAQQAAQEHLARALAAQKAAYAALASGKITSQERESFHNSNGVDMTELERQCWRSDVPLKRVLYQLRGNAVAFSGGGIRSASFSLGVLQGLARFTFAVDSPPQPKPLAADGLMQDVHYISTVSGGGYLGSWLSSWIARVSGRMPGGGKQPTNVQAAYLTVMDALAGNIEQTSADPAPEPVRHLRQFTSYLSPQFGFSLDFFALAAIVLRNLVVNWLMLGPLLLAMVAFPEFLALALRETGILIKQGMDGVLFAVMFICIFCAGCAAGLSLPFYVAQAETATGQPRNWRLGGKGVTGWFLVPILVVCWLLSAHFYPGTKHDSWKDAQLLSEVAAGGFCTLALLKFRSIHKALKMIGSRDDVPVSRTKACLLLISVTLGVSLLTGVGLELTGTRLLPMLTSWDLPLTTPPPKATADLSELMGRLSYDIFSFPCFVSVLLLGSSLFSAFTQQLESEEDREWWARAGGMLIVVSMVWTISVLLTVYARKWSGVAAWNWAAVLPSLGIGGLTSRLAKSSKTSVGARPEKSTDQDSIVGFLKSSNLLLPAMALLSLALIAMSLMGLGEHLRIHLPYRDEPVKNSLMLLLLLALTGALVNVVININVFSLHGLYRMRLTRAFLGASNSSRHPDPFTGFDPEDALKMHELPRADGVPLHILGTTLNLVGTKRAEWRQRKAESFTFSAVSAGAWRLNYVDVQSYGGRKGVSLGTAMAISGAAANPNMGYHSSPIVTLLMTLFNARLGWWLPNPSYPLREVYSEEKTRKLLQSASPTFGLGPLIEELFGKTDDEGKWIELSDGGHFDNLGLYEMVMRRVKNILVVDAGADSEFHFEDLGNALRKIEIDLGIPIRFHGGLNMKEGSLPSNRYCAVAEIDYSCVDSVCFADKQYNNPSSPSMQGQLVYIKACLNGGEPMDVREYAFSHPKFPHESTANQFFNEAQFESYRHLGSNAVETLERAADGRTWVDFVAAARLVSANGTAAPGAETPGKTGDEKTGDGERQHKPGTL